MIYIEVAKFRGGGGDGKSGVGGCRGGKSVIEVGGESGARIPGGGGRGFKPQKIAQKNEKIQFFSKIYPYYIV